MYPHVYGQVAGRREGLLAEVAGVGLLAVVGALVHVQVRLYGEPWERIAIIYVHYLIVI